jgi:hypothetical protein
MVCLYDKATVYKVQTNSVIPMVWALQQGLELVVLAPVQEILDREDILQPEVIFV